MRKLCLVVAALLLISSLGHMVPGTTPEGPAAPAANSPPKAVISEPRNGAVILVGSQTLFDGSNSTDPDNDTLRYRWQFGDGGEAFTARATHAYAQPAVRIVNLTVNDSRAEDKATIFVNVVPVPSPGKYNTPPKAAIDGNKTGYTGEVIYFTSLATDPNGDNLSYYWSFGESKFVNYLKPDTTGKVVEHIYNSTGNFTVTHWVQETNTTEHYVSAPASAWANITSLPVYPPLADAGPNITAEVNTEVTLSGSGASRNPGGTITRYEWDFDGDGTYDSSSNTTGKAKHAYTAVRAYMPRLRVTDDKGLTAEDTTNVTITTKPNIPPIANAGDDQSVFAGQSVALSGTGSDQDGQVVRYQWDFDGDGVWDYDSPSSGTAGCTYENPGTYEAKLRVTDDRGASAEDTAVITVSLKKPPVADAGGDQTVACGDDVQFDGTGSKDPDGQRLTFSWDFDDRDGLQTDATGPVADHVYTKGGQYTVTLTVTDEMGKTARDTALVTAVQTAGVSIGANPRSKNLAPGEEAQFSISVKNSGNGDDTFDLFLSGDNYRWGTLDTAEFLLAAGASRTVGLAVSPPVDAAAGAQARITVRAVSGFDQNAAAQTQLSVTVLQTYGLNVSADRTRLGADAGRSATFNLVVGNSGNGDDLVRIVPSGAAGKWATVTPAQVVVAKGASRTVAVKVKVPAGAEAKDYILTLTAFSGANTTQTSLGVTVAVRASGAPVFVPGFELAGIFAAMVGAAAVTFRRRKL